MKDPNCLYLAPGILEETTRELGLPFPADKKAALEYVGLDPVNKAELIAEWSKNGR